MQRDKYLYLILEIIARNDVSNINSFLQDKPSIQGCKLSLSSTGLATRYPGMSYNARLKSEEKEKEREKRGKRVGERKQKKKKGKRAFVGIATSFYARERRNEKRRGRRRREKRRDPGHTRPSREFDSTERLFRLEPSLSSP